MKKLLLTTLAILSATQLFPHGYYGGGGYGGGFATGAIIGTGIGIAASHSGVSRDPEYYQSKTDQQKIKSLNNRIREKQKSIKRLEKLNKRLEKKK